MSCKIAFCRFSFLGVLLLFAVFLFLAFCCFLPFFFSWRLLLFLLLVFTLAPLAAGVAPTPCWQQGRCVKCRGLVGQCQGISFQPLTCDYWYCISLDELRQSIDGHVVDADQLFATYATFSEHRIP